MKHLRLMLTGLGFLGLVALPLAAAAEEADGGDVTEIEAVEGEEITESEEGSTMAAVDSTAKHLENLQERLDAEGTPEAAQGGLGHALEVSAHGHEVVSAVHEEGLRGQDLAEIASSMRGSEHGPPGSPGARANAGRPAGIPAGPPDGIPAGQP